MSALSKHPTYQDVRDQALKLINEKGSTTTLEIKNSLRDKGFTVFQSDVSSWMEEIASKETLAYTFNGQYRTYTQATVSNVQAQAQPSQQGALQSPGQGGGRVKVFLTPLHTSANTMNKTDVLAQFGQDDWVVYDRYNSHPLYIYAAAETRDHIRTHYSRTHKMKIQDVRACALKNFFS